MRMACASRCDLTRSAQMSRSSNTPHDGPFFAELEPMRSLFGLTLLTACATSSSGGNGGPRGPRADDHIAAAAREDERSNELTRWPETRPSEPGLANMQVVWLGTWDTTAEHHRRAEAHRSAAVQIEVEYEQACGDTPAAVASISPLQRYGIGGSATTDGALVILSPEAGPPNRLLAEMRCHRAWMMLGRSDMQDCPLDLPGLHVSAHGDATQIELTLTVENASLIPELQRRAAHDLEAAGKHSAAAK